MAPGRKRLRKIQLGLETTAGTATTATTIWRGMGNMLEDQQVVEEVEEMVGYLDGADRTNVVKLLGGLSLDETPLNFEQVQYLFAMGEGGPSTGASDGSGSDKIYTTNITTNTAPTAKTYTLQGGDDFEAEVMPYCLATKVNIKGVHGSTAKMSATLLGRSVTTNAFTGSLSLPTIEDAITSKGKVYLDAIGGTYGSTQVANQILAFELNYEFHWVPKWTMDGNLYFTMPVYAGHKITGKITFEHDTAVSGTGGAKQNFRTQTARLLRVDLIGSAVTTAGSTYSTKHAIFDLPIKYTKAPVITDVNGNDIVVMEFRSRFNSTAGNQGKVVVVNELASLT